jgi:hypothetical protein
MSLVTMQPIAPAASNLTFGSVSRMFGARRAAALDAKATS